MIPEKIELPETIDGGGCAVVMLSVFVGFGVLIFASLVAMESSLSSNGETVIGLLMWLIIIVLGVFTGRILDAPYAVSNEAKRQEREKRLSKANAAIRERIFISVFDLSVKGVVSGSSAAGFGSVAGKAGASSVYLRWLFNEEWISMTFPAAAVVWKPGELVTCQFPEANYDDGGRLRFGGSVIIIDPQLLS